MVHLPPALALLALATSGAAQKLNSWPQHNYGASDITDNDINTVAERNIDPQYGASYSFLFNFNVGLSGFYVQSSGDFITDYYIDATVPVDAGIYKSAEVGRVCGAAGNFTFVPLANPDTGKALYSATLFLSVTRTVGNSSTAVINEVWPVFPGDEVVDPENTSPCPAPTK